MITKQFRAGFIFLVFFMSLRLNSGSCQKLFCIPWCSLRVAVETKEHHILRNRREYGLSNCSQFAQVSNSHFACFDRGPFHCSAQLPIEICAIDEPIQSHDLDLIICASRGREAATYLPAGRELNAGGSVNRATGSA